MPLTDDGAKWPDSEDTGQSPSCNSARPLNEVCADCKVAPQRKRPGKATRRRTISRAGGEEDTIEDNKVTSDRLVYKKRKYTTRTYNGVK